MGALATLSESQIVPAHTAPIQSIAFAATPDLYATGDTQRHVRVWHRGSILFDINLSSAYDKVKPTERIRGLAFSPAGETLYTACGDELRAYSMTTGEARWSYKPPRYFGFLIISPMALSVAASGDIAMATDSGRMSVWTPEGAMKSHWWDNDNPRHLAFVDGERIIGTDSFTVCTWKSTIGRKQDKRRLEERAYGFAATPDGKRICLRSIHSVQVLDYESQDLIEIYPLDFGPPLVSISNDGTRVAVGGLTDIYVYTIGRQNTQRLHLGSVAPRSLRISPGGNSVAVGCADGTLRFWDLD